MHCETETEKPSELNICPSQHREVANEEVGERRVEKSVSTPPKGEYVNIAVLFESFGKKKFKFDAFPPQEKPESDETENPLLERIALKAMENMR
jgi:hypothetical protein